MGFAQVSFEDDESKWGRKTENMKTYRVAEDPLDDSFLNEVFYRCHLELQHPGHQDQVIRIRRSLDPGYLFEPHNCLSKLFKNGFENMKK